MAIVATSTTPRPGGPASSGAARSSHDHVGDHGRLSSHAASGGGQAEAGEPRRRPPAAAGGQGGQPEDDGHDHDDREHSGGEGHGERRDDRQQRRAPDAFAARQADDAVDELVGGGAGVSRADAHGDAQQVDEPRHRGVGDERREPAGGDDARHQRDRRVDQEGGDAGPVRRVQGGQAPRPEDAEEDQPDDEHGEPEAHPEQPQHAGDRHHGPAGRVGDGGRRSRPGSSRRRSRSTTGAGCRAAGGARRCWDRGVDQRATGDDDPDHDHDPGDGHPERALPPAPDVGVGADVRLGVAGPPVRRQAGAAAVLQVEDLGVADAPEDRAPPG